MKKNATTFLLNLLLLSILLTGCSSNQKSSSTQANNSASEQSHISGLTAQESQQASQNTNSSKPKDKEVSIPEEWYGTYHSTDGEKEITLTISGGDIAAVIDGATVALTPKADHGSEIQLIDGNEDVYHLVIFTDNPIDKRYDFAVTAKEDSSVEIIDSTFMRREGDVDLPQSSVTVSDTTQSDADDSHDTGSEDNDIDNSDSDTVPDDGQSHQVGTIDSSGFIGVVYKNEYTDLGLTFKLQNPDENGFPAEIVLNGNTYDDNVSFNNQTYTLKSTMVLMRRGGGYTNIQIVADFVVGDMICSFDMVGSRADGEEDIESWRMYGPSFCSGDYYPE